MNMSRHIGYNVDKTQGSGLASIIKGQAIRWVICWWKAFGMKLKVLQLGLIQREVTGIQSRNLAR